MEKPLIEVLIILLLLIVNGIFAMAEIAVVSARKARLQQQAGKGDLGAQRALEMANNPNELLSTVQIGITLIGILAGAFGGATIAEEIALLFDRVSWLKPYSEALGVGLVVIVVTYLSLIIGELVPKRLALNNPERTAAKLAYPMKILAKIVRPLNRLLSISTDAVMRLLRAHPSDEPAVTEEEVKVLIEQGTQLGIFVEEEQDMIDGVLRLGDQHVGALLTPRRQVVWLDVQDSLDEIRAKVTQSEHARFPVIRDGEEDIIGIVHAKDLLGQLLSGQPLDVHAVMRPSIFVPESTLVLELLALFKERGADMAIVIDEYGGVEGIVTQTDILEMIVGAMPTEAELGEPEATQREDGSWLLDGLLHIDALKDILGVELLPGEKQARFQTVAGFMLAQIGSIPEPGAHFEWGQYHFEVMDMDGNRIDKVLSARRSKNDF